MKITVVRYRRLQSHKHGYGHDAFEAEAQVDDGETAEEAVAALREWVDGQLAAAAKVLDLRDTVELLTHEVEVQTRTRDRLKSEAEEYRKITKAGTDLYNLAVQAGRSDLVDLFADEIPF
ncbi:hypothetical protein HRJ34_14700 [Rhizorhabdus wittichii]|uniref:Uncharacterized protein n=1 Tax=Rhizorhabdus wittichii TaxID=160791 RepID=A0A975CZ12_9SPHN|nr:hypothetical protein [Rhizorhabdus wittichii]QTH19624.1 hypothetical protein HRJ34_14700 [Rhizorhabdus wittichii]